MYKLKQMVKRGSAFAGAVGLLAGISTSALPALTSADDLNPLTERSLSLSSSSPGWAFTDGSGNSTYAGPNTGTNGQKTGNTFSFRTSSTAAIKAFTFQYCTSAAGNCAAPGDNSPITGNNDPTGASGTSDLDIVTDPTTNSEVSDTDYTDTLASATTGAGFGQVKQVPDGQDTVSPYDYSHQHGTDESNGVDGNFVVLYGSAASGHVTDVSSGWTMAASNQEEASTGKTTKNNMMTLAIDGTTNTTGISLAPDDYVKIIFFGTDKNYITNPGSGAFFVKINDYNDAAATHVVDGGVTVANVMNQSIAIQTKVLETMDFSVGTVDPDTLSSAGGTAGDGTQTPFEAAEGITNPSDGTTPHAKHGQCDAVLTGMTPTDSANVLTLGNSDSEDSLETNHTFATHSYWRLSSNSSGGATVYYAGNTLSNTEGDKIAAIGTTAATPTTGSEQFGLALDQDMSATQDGHNTYAVNYTWAHADPISSVAYEAGADQSLEANENSSGFDSSFGTDTTSYGASVHDPQLWPLVPTDGTNGTTNYGLGDGGVNLLKDGGGTTVESVGSSYAFDPNSQTVPTPIATESSQVVDCVTGKMRYIGNIAATTPAGIYTTKINYVAAPQY